MRETTRTHGDIFSEVPKLGPAITSSRPTPPEQTHGPPLELDVDENQNLNSKFVLSGEQRKLITKGTVGDQSKRNRQILTKRDLLPERIQHLIDDVAVLYAGPYLSCESWEDGISPKREKRSKWADIQAWLEGEAESTEEIDLKQFEDTDVEHYESPFETPAELWEELIQVNQRSQQVRNEVHFHGNSVSAKETQFGFEIGSVLRMLRPAYGDDPPGVDLIWGFILAFVGGSKETVSDEGDTLEALLTEIENRHEERLRESKQMPDPSEINDAGREVDTITEDAVEEMGLEPHPILVREISYHRPTLDDEELDKKAAQKVLSDFLDVVPLEAIDELRDRLSSDLQAIRERSVPGIESARQILQAYAEENESDEELRFRPRLATPEIARQHSLDDSVVTATFNRISAGKGDERWVSESVVNRIEGEGRHVTWELTAYGKLLLYTSFGCSDDLSILYWYALGPEELSLRERKLITDALAELGYVT